MSTPAQLAAHTYAERGWRVVPIKPGTKRPPMNAWQDEATTDPTLIDDWYVGPYMGFGVGVATGHGLVVLDVDVADGKSGDKSLRQLEADHGDLPDTLVVLTPTGGRHFYYSLPAGVVIRNNASTKLGAGLDIRGEGGQVVAPPTIHPTTGTPYAWAKTKGAILAECPTWLIDLLVDHEPNVAGLKSFTPAEQETLRQLAAKAKPASARKSTLPRPPSSHDADALTPVDDYNARVTCGAILERHGWTAARRANPSGDHDYVRPGKAERDGISATVFANNGKVSIWSTTPGLPTDENMSAYYLMALLDYGGDMAAATRALRADGYGDDKALAVGDRVPKPLDDDEWPEPIPLSEAHTLPEFPLDVLPDVIAAQCRNVARSTNVSTDCPAMLSLAMLAALAAGRADLTVVGAWRETLNLYIVVGMPPSSGKSPVMKQIRKPLDVIQNDLTERGATMRSMAAQKRRILEARVKHLESVAVKGKGDELDRASAMNDAANAQQELDDMPEQFAPRLTADDSTPEALVQLLSEQGGRIAFVSTEGGVYDAMAGRYGDGPNLDVYLKAWSGDPIRVDRKHAPPIDVERPLVTMALTVQPTVIAAVGQDREMTGKGLSARFMYALPADNVGRRDLRNTPASDPAIAQAYTDLLVSLGNRWREMIARELALSPAAYDLFIDWRQGLESRRGPDGDLHDMREWSGKCESSTARLAALFHLTEDQRGEQVGAETMARAIAVGDYWIEHAKAVHDLWGTNDRVRFARLVKAWIQRGARATFTLQETQRGGPLRGMDRDSAGPIIDLLIERYWIAPEDAEWRRKWVQGTKSPVMVASPAMFRAEIAPIAPVAPKTLKSENLSLSESEYERETPGVTGAIGAIDPDALSDSDGDIDDLA